MDAAEYTHYVGPAVHKQRLGELLAADVLLPPKPWLAGFAAVADLIDAQITANSSESTTLGRFRDPLLPQLISSEIHLKQAEKIVEAPA